MLSTAIVAIAIGFGGGSPTPPQLLVTLAGGKTFTITTDKKGSPKTVQHIIALVAKKFYDGIKVHRVENWVTQWGDPQTKTKPITAPGIGSGGSGKDVPFEGSKVSFVRGVVGLASTGKKVGGDCQLFVLKKDATYLNGDYAVVGVVTKGMTVIDAVKAGEVIKSIRVIPHK